MYSSGITHLKRDCTLEKQKKFIFGGTKMKKLHKVLAGAMSLVTVISAASCNGGNSGGGREPSAAGNTDAAATTTTAATTVFASETYDTNAEVQGAVANLEVDESLNPTQKLVFMGNWTIDNTLPAVELFKAKYGTPTEISEAYKSYLNEKNEDYVVVSDVVDYQARYDKLGTAISAGLAPDIFPFENDIFPLPAYKNMFQNIDDIIDMSGSEWDGWRELSDQYTWAGKHYLAPCEFYPAQVLYYRRSVIEEAGLQDPYELFVNGEWTWDTFLDMADKFQQTGENKYVCDGWYIQSLIFSTTGVPIIGMKDGRIVNNLYDANVERAAEVISKLCSENYRYPLVENNWSVNEKAWVNGDTLFFDDGFWFYQGNGHKYCEKMGWDYDEVFFVPAPKDPKADKYYHSYKVFGYALCSGSTNIDSYKAWIQCNMLVLEDEDVQAAARAQQMENEKWTETQMEFKTKLYSVKDTPLTPSYDFRTGIDTDNAKSDGSAPIDHIVKDPYNDTANTFSGARAEYNNVIQASVDELNAALEKLGA